MAPLPRRFHTRRRLRMVHERKNESPSVRRFALRARASRDGDRDPASDA